MNPVEATVQAAQHQLALQIGAAIMMGLSICSVVLVAIAHLAGWRRICSCGIMLFGFFSFWIPAPLTLIVSPIIFLLGAAALIVQLVTARIAKTRISVASPA